MALDPATRFLIEENKDKFSTDNMNVPNPRSRENMELDRMFSAFTPEKTNKKFEDYSGYISGAIDPIYGDIDEARAQEQNSTLGGRALTLGKTIPRALTKAIGEVAKIPGELEGLGEWAVKGFNVEDFESTVNNAWVRSIDEAQQSVNEELFPVYKRRVIENGGLFRQIISPEFWATEGADGAGFLLGMMAPGALLKMASLGEKAVVGLGFLSDGAKWAKAEKGAKLASNIDDIAAASINTVVEAGAEGVEGAKATSRELYQKKLNEGIAMGLNYQQAANNATEYLKTPEAKAIAGTAGYNTFKSNLAILIGPNILDQKWFMKGANKMINAAERVEKGRMAGAISDILSPEDAINKITRSTAKELRNEGLKKGVVGVFKEGFFEEGMQSTVSNYYKDRAIAKEDPTIGEELSGIVGEYFSGLSDIDMQKSIFLGSVMGGVMGGIGARNAKKREDDVIFGDPKTGRVGFKGLIEGNLINRWKTINDLTEKEDDGNGGLRPKYVNGKPVFNIAKVKQWGASVANSDVNKKLMKAYEDNGDVDGFEFAKDIHDFNYMMPFFQQEGGKKLLLQHINQLAEKDAAKLKEAGIEPQSVADIKSDLTNKVDRFEQLYWGRVKNHVAPNIKVDKENTETFKAFNSMLLDTKTSNVLAQDFSQKKINEINTELGKPNLQDSDITKLSEKLESYTKTLSELKDSYKQLESKDSVEKTWNELIEMKKKVSGQVVKETIDNATTPEEVAEAAKAAAQSGNAEAANSAIVDAAANEPPVIHNTPPKTRKKKVMDKSIEDDLRAELEGSIPQVTPPVVVGQEVNETSGEVIDRKFHLMAEHTGAPATEHLNVSELKDQIITALNDSKNKIKNKVQVRASLEAIKNATSVESINQAIISLHELDNDLVSNIVDDVVKNFKATKHNDQLAAQNELEVINPVVESLSSDRVDNSEDVVTEESLDDKDLSRDVFTGNVMEFKIEKSTGVTNFNDPGTLQIEDKDFSHDYNNDPDELTNNFQVTFEVDFDSNYNKRVVAKKDGKPVPEKYDSVGIYVVHYDKTGKRHIISVLGSPATNKTNGLSELRKKIIDQAVSNYKTGETSKTNITSNAFKGRGKFRSNKPRSIITKIKEKFLPNGKIIVGYVGYDFERGIYIETPNESGLDKASVSRQPGSIVIWLKAANGQLVPARAFTKTFKDLESTNKKLYDKEFSKILSVLGSLNSNNYKEQLDFIKDYYFHISPVIKKDKDGNPTKLTLIHDSLYSAIKSLPVDRKSNEFKVAFDNIEESFNLKDKLWSILKGQQVLSTKGYEHVAYTIDLSKSKSEFASDKSSIFSPEFKEFVGNLNHQISKKHVNGATINDKGETVDFNKDVLPQYLHVNFDPEAPFHSPIFNIDPNYTETISEIEVEKVKKVAPKKKSLSKKDLAPKNEIDQEINNQVAVENATKTDSNFTNEVVNEVNQSSPEIMVQGEDIDDKKIEVASKGVSRRKSNPLQNKKSSEDSNARTVNENVEFKIWDQEKEMTWLKANLPIDDNVLSASVSKTLLHLDGREAWGLFSKNLIQVYQKAMEGTAYHEGFHAVFQMALNPVERIVLLKEAKAKFNTSNDDFAEEQMADGLIDYIKSDGENISGWGDRVIAFFKRIYAFIKYGLLNSQTIDGLYYRINNGYYKNRTFKDSIKGAPSSAALNYIETKQRVADIASTLSQVVDELKMIEGNERKSRLELIKEYGIIAEVVNGEYRDGIALMAFDKIDEKWSESGQRGTNSNIDMQFGLMVNGLFKIEINEDGFAELPQLPELNNLGISALRKFAQVEKIKLKLPNGTTLEGIDPSTEEDSIELDENQNKLEHWMIKATEQSLKDRVGNDVKSVLARIPIKENGVEVKNSLGFTQYLDYNESFATLLREMANCTSVAQMIENLTEFAEFKPEYSSVLEKMNNDIPFRAKFWDAMQNIHMNYTILKQQSLSEDSALPLEDRRMKWNFMSANRQAVTSSVLESWRDDINNAYKSIVVAKKTDSNMTDAQYKLWLASEYAKMVGNDKVKGWWSDLVSSINKKDKLTNEDVAPFVKRMNDIGIDITADEMILLRSIDAKGNDKNQLNILFQKLRVVSSLIYSGKDPIVENDPNIKAAARLISRARPEMMEDSFRDLNNKTNYSHTLMGFLTRFFSDIKRETKNGWDRSKIDNLKSAPGYRLLPWLTNLENKKDRDNFEYSIFKGTSEENQYRGTNYSQMSARELNAARLNAFFNNGTVDYSNYMVPTLAGSGVGMFIRARRLPLVSNDTQNTTDALYLTLRSEWELVKNSDNFKGIKNIDKNSANFVLFAGLFEGSELTQSELKQQMTDIDNEIAGYEDIKQQVKDTLENYMEKKHLQMMRIFESQGIISKDEKGNYTSDMIDAKVDMEDVNKNKRFSNIEAFIRSYTYNYIVAKPQMLMLLTGTSAAYKNTEDLYKRLKEISTPGSRLDIDATFELNKEQAEIEGSSSITTGKTYTAIVINDINEDTNIEMAQASLDIQLDKAKSGELSYAEAYGIAARFGYSNGEKDGVKGVFAMDKNGKKITYNGEDLFFKSGTNNLTDGYSMVRPKRYRAIKLGAGRWNSELHDEFNKFMDGSPTTSVNNPFKPFVFGHRVINGMRVPYQIKNAESVYDPRVSFMTVDGEIKFPTKDNMSNGFEGYKYPLLAKMAYVMEANNIDAIHFNSTFKVGEFGTISMDALDGDISGNVQTLNNEDYLLIDETSDHFSDASGQAGVQIRKLGISDISEEAIFDVNGMGDNVTKDELISKYHEIISADVQSAFESIDAEFPKISEPIEEYNAKLEKLSNRLVASMEAQNMGQDSIDAVRTYIPANGGGRAAFKVHIFDPIHSGKMSNLIGSMFKNGVVKHKVKGGNLVMVSSVGYSDKLEIVRGENGNVKEIQCYMPWYSESAFAGLMDENGVVDVNKITDPKLLEVIGYRIPTEDKYSMLPLKIMRFLPRSIGGVIVLPREITTLSGADFDVDKLYLFIRNYTEDYNKDEVSKINSTIKSSHFAAVKTGKFESVFSNEAYDIVRILDIIKKTRDESKLDREDKLVYSLYKQGLRSGIFNPPYSYNSNQFDYSKPALEQSKEARDNAKIDILWGVLTNSDTASKLLNPGNFDYYTGIVDEIKKKKNYKKNLDVIDPMTDITMFEAASAADGLIGVFANHNIGHSIFQHGNIRLAKPIKFNGVDYSNLSNISGTENVDGEFFMMEPKRVSRKLSMLLSAIVDDLKSLNSGPGNVNFFTVDVLCTAIRMGLSLKSSMSLLNQPSVMRLTQKYFELGGDFEAYKSAYKITLEEYGNNSTVSSNDLTPEILWENIGSKDKTGDIAEQQIAALEMFDQIRESSMDVGLMTKVFKSDDTKRKVTLSSNEVFDRNVKKARKIKTILGFNELWEKYSMLKAFHKYGVLETTKSLSELFPYAKPAFMAIKNKIAKNLVGKRDLTEEQIDNLNYEILGAISSGFEFFNGEIPYGDSNITTREYLLKSFPGEFLRIVTANPELKKYRIIKNLKFKPANSAGQIDYLRHNTTGKMTDQDVAEIKDDWLDLLFYTNPKDLKKQAEFRKLGEAMVKYTYFAYGFHLNKDSFSQFIPLAWRSGLSDSNGLLYNDYLQQQFNAAENNMHLKNLYRQIKQHKYKNSFFVPRLDFDKVKKYITFDEKETITGFSVYDAHGHSDKVATADGYADFITIVKGGKYYFMEQSSIATSDSGKVIGAHYQLAESLGIKDHAQEYSLGASMKSSIFQFNKNGVKTTIEPSTISKSAAILKDIVGENISSKGSELGRKLTNVGNSIGLTYKGKQYLNAEHAYQTWKSGQFNQKGYDLNGSKVRGGKIGDTLSIMKDIVAEKLKQNPNLVNEINSKGGLEYLEKSTHNVIGDKFWESNGENNFMNALIYAYKMLSSKPKEKAFEPISREEFDAEVNDMMSDSGYWESFSNKEDQDEIDEINKTC